MIPDHQVPNCISFFLYLFLPVLTSVRLTFLFVLLAYLVEYNRTIFYNLDHHSNIYQQMNLVAKMIYQLIYLVLHIQQTGTKLKDRIVQTKQIIHSYKQKPKYKKIIKYGNSKKNKKQHSKQKIYKYVSNYQSRPFNLIDTTEKYIHTVLHIAITSNHLIQRRYCYAIGCCSR